MTFIHLLHNRDASLCIQLQLYNICEPVKRSIFLVDLLPIEKQSITRCTIAALGIEGDEQAERFHGGADSRVAITICAVTLCDTSGRISNSVDYFRLGAFGEILLQKDLMRKHWYR